MSVPRPLAPFFLFYFSLFCLLQFAASGEPRSCVVIVVPCPFPKMSLLLAEVVPSSVSHVHVNICYRDSGQEPPPPPHTHRLKILGAVFRLSLWSTLNLLDFVI